jgi:hypothetical protein
VVPVVSAPTQNRFLPDPEPLERAQQRAYEDVKQRLRNQGFRTRVVQ